jgi:Flp pilus assembly protein TadG
MRQTTRFWGPAQARDGRVSKGQSVVELALLLPVLVILVAGIVDLGRIYYTYITVINVAREGVRFAAAHPPSSCAPDADPTGVDRIKTRAREEAVMNRINPAQLEIGVYCDSTDVDSWIKVSVWYNFRMIAAGMLYDWPAIRLRHEATMQIFGR